MELLLLSCWKVYINDICTTFGLTRKTHKVFQIVLANWFLFNRIPYFNISSWYQSDICCNLRTNYEEIFVNQLIKTYALFLNSELFYPCDFHFCFSKIFGVFWSFLVIALVSIIVAVLFSVLIDWRTGNLLPDCWVVKMLRCSLIILIESWQI